MVDIVNTVDTLKPGESLQMTEVTDIRKTQDLINFVKEKNAATLN